MFDVNGLRQQFPALNQSGNGDLSPIFADGPGGTQVPRRVIEAMVSYLSTCNANAGGLFRTSRESDRLLSTAHEAVADLLNVSSPNEIVFGANMTTLTFHLSRAVAGILKPGDEVLVTRLDHDANVTPWVLAARDAGARARTVDIHVEDCTLDMDDLRRQLTSRTRLIAVGCASNAVGTVNDVHTVVRWAHEVGALVFVDAVHYAPHGPIDVQSWGCDFLACSAYKFFGPHVGVLWGRRELLESLPTYKLRPPADSLPGRWMTGTQNHEGLAGVAAAVEYLCSIGAAANPTADRRRQLKTALTSIQAYEAELGKRLLEGLAARPRFKVWGIKEPVRMAERVPTLSITMPGRPAAELARQLATRHVYAWHGNMYALSLSERLGLEDKGGFLRLGLVHYNTAEEIDRLLAALDEL